MRNLRRNQEDERIIVPLNEQNGTETSITKDSSTGSATVKSNQEPLFPTETLPSLTITITPPTVTNNPTTKILTKISTFISGTLTTLTSTIEVPITTDTSSVPTPTLPIDIPPPKEPGVDKIPPDDGSVPENTKGEKTPPNQDEVDDISNTPGKYDDDDTEKNSDKKPGASKEPKGSEEPKNQEKVPKGDKKPGKAKAQKGGKKTKVSKKTKGPEVQKDPKEPEVPEGPKISKVPGEGGVPEGGKEPKVPGEGGVPEGGKEPKVPGEGGVPGGGNEPKVPGEGGGPGGGKEPKAPEEGGVPGGAGKEPKIPTEGGVPVGDKEKGVPPKEPEAPGGQGSNTPESDVPKLPGGNNVSEVTDDYMGNSKTLGLAIGGVLAGIIAIGMMLIVLLKKNKICTEEKELTASDSMESGQPSPAAPPEVYLRQNRTSANSSIISTISSSSLRLISAIKNSVSNILPIPNDAANLTGRSKFIEQL
ncbi:10707_t:CDS:2 [Funneliformis mosseae]|uniref:10707_t:CDS:1 n=1 Tax=Funneliformis mosseae TaxID=27381 RepID=A0A9N9A813_FUNMO|nr:10707_t:CDS:2 [Funneliformis mosseae]